MAVGPWQIIVVVLIVLLLFGAGRISEIGKGLGEGIKNFKKGLSDDDKDEVASGKTAKKLDDKKKKKKAKKVEAEDAEFEDADDEDEDKES